MIPQRDLTLLVIEDDGGRVWLETRPPAGIWGGLQSLPELPKGSDAAAWLQQYFGGSVIAVSPAPTFIHPLTHFRLHIRPLICRIERPSSGTDRVSDCCGHWLDAHEWPQAALPAPVRALLARVVGKPLPGEN